MLERTRATVADSCRDPVELTGVAFSSHAVSRFAATRRVLDADDKASVRWSVTRDPAVRQAPEGTIDPMLDQLILYGPGNQPVACLNSYACHPQVGYLPGIVHGDTIGIALDLFEETFPGVFPLYFDGCGGDVTAGKYTTPNVRRNMHVFGVRLFDAMEEAFRKARPRPVGEVAWHDSSFDVPLAPVTWSVDEMEAVIAAPDTAPGTAYLHAIKLEQLQTGRTAYPFRMSRLCLGGGAMLFLPTELCVEYQLHAKAHHRGPLVVAAYGDSYLNYVATDKAFAQGGYEVEPIWTQVEPGIEVLIKQHLDGFLG